MLVNRKISQSALGIVLSATLLTACGGSSNHTKASATPGGETPKNFELLEATVADIHAAFKGEQVAESGQPLSCVALAEQYLARIETLDNTTETGLPISSIVSINPAWREQAKALDTAFASNGLVGPLHCVPVLLKDLYDTFDFPTTASSRALAGSQPPDDAFTVARLREAGALILGKAGMSEYAFWTQSLNSVSLRIGTPYDTSRDAGGSSGGSAAAIAANFGLLGTGSDTCASIRLPPSNNALVGVRSTVGLVSQDGLVPLSHTMDVGGPITRTVRDAALMLNIMAGVDPADPRTHAADRYQPSSYLDYLDKNALKGKRIGVLRSYGGTDAFGNNTDVNAAMEQALIDLAAAGAEIIDPITLPDFNDISNSLIVQEFADHMDEYLASFDAPRTDTVDIFTSGLVHPFIEAIIGVSIAARDTSSSRYIAQLDERKALRDYVEAEMDALGLDALVYPPAQQPARPTGLVQTNNCGFGSTTAMPSIVVPAGFSSDQPALPIGIEFFGRSWDEATLFGIAYAYEQSTQHRRRPILPGDPAP
ncbi:Asp-tRNA(Asn)/Glu-tRNA(Gln) amidotransferase A subunit family amidase [Zhongshania antarctica]|uniref:Asp-tRNA(Asn)/Glu-tRNA(Gln) amidotransferase A subunit family amidase n=1 Tax=Zhongshania antarctica TaxID=641702 RepID=A0A840R9B9_9GAMM|nr:amidase family protein [Zhongshania antarctica]MBB5189184.1 Asp-tRNA(Asn)/Glu-tRNA(Gln) amidotransferase A subunit family amidase [Zhongshania antarctica]